MKPFSETPLRFKLLSYVSLCSVPHLPVPQSLRIHACASKDGEVSAIWEKWDRRDRQGHVGAVERAGRECEESWGPWRGCRARVGVFLKLRPPLDSSCHLVSTIPR